MFARNLEHSCAEVQPHRVVSMLFHTPLSILGSFCRVSLTLRLIVIHPLSSDLIDSPVSIFHFLLSLPSIHIGFRLDSPGLIM